MQRDYSPVQTSPTQDLSDDNSSDSDGLLKEEKNFQLQGHRKTFWRRHAVTICGHLTVFLLYTTIVQVLFAASWRWQMLLGASPKSLLYSPANEALHWKLDTFDSGDGHEGPYSGYPRPDLDKAWEDLLGNMNVRFQLEDLKVWGRDVDAVALPDGSGYLGTLNVYHEIHCVKWMHTYMYQEFYWPDLDDHQREENRLHSEHCLNMLRKSAMCHGDVGMVTYKWNPHSRKPQANATSHQCIDWQSLVDWTEERAVNIFEPGLLIHPTLGPAYDTDDMTQNPH